MIGGTEAERYHWPWVASIVVPSESRDWKTECTAVILNENWVLTAASCFVRPLISFPFVNITSKGFVLAGITDIRDAGASKRFKIERTIVPDEIQTLANKKILTEENYFGYVSNQDIALIKGECYYNYDISRIHIGVQFLN